MLAKIKKYYWHPISSSMILFTAWLWSFPMYGPFLSLSGNNIHQLFLLFLFSHTLGLILFGILGDILYRKVTDLSREVLVIKIFSILIGFLTFIFPLFPGLNVLLIILTGLLSAPLVIFYLFSLSRGNKLAHRGKILGLIFFLAGLVSLIFLLIPLNNWLFGLIGLFPLATSFIDGSKLLKKIEINISLPETNAKYWLGLIFLVLLFYVGGGLMYSLSYTRVYASGSNFDIGFIFYTILALPAGILADKRGRRHLVNFGLSFAGTGFLLMLIFSVQSINSISLGLLQGGFVAMDLFVFLTLVDWTTSFQSRRFIGIGLFINVIVVFLSSLPFLENNVRNFLPVNFAPAVGLLLIFMIIPLLNLIKETLVKQNNIKIKEELPTLDDFYLKYELTARETEIAQLLIDGYTTGEITEELFITYNTLKTHLRNIYRKTETGSQTDFILLAWRETKK